MVERDELPISGYDQLTVPALTDRIRSLRADQVQRLLDYERGHGDRQPVKQVLAARLDQLAAGRQPSGGGSSERDEPLPPGGGSPVSPATAGAPVNPPPHGVPAQPAEPKGDRR